MSTLSQSRVTAFKNAWITFYSRGKMGAYIEDQLVTTHPIESKIPDTESAFSNFDGITYGKGASALKQLSYYIGEDAFREGVRNYFKDHAYANTKLEDFIGALERSSGKELQHWEKSWLEQAGVDTVEAEYTCDASGKVRNFALKLQGPGGAPSPRVHRTLVAMYQEKDGKVVPLLQQSVIYKGARTEVHEFNGAACPTMVYPNEQDYDYVKVRLDARTLASAKLNLSKVASTFTRVIFWPNLYSMVRDVELAPQDYLKIVLQNFPKETDMTIADAILPTLGRTINYLPLTTDAEKQARAKQVTDVENMLWSGIETAKNPDWQKMLLGTFTEIAESQTARDHLVGLLDGKIKFKKLVIDADRRWEMIIHLSSLGDARVEPLFAKQRELDKSSRGVSSSYAVEATKPSLEVKKEWIGTVVDHNNLSFEQKRTIFYNMLPRTQDDLRASLSDKYYSSLPKLAKEREMQFLGMYTRALMPATCTQASATKLGNFVSESSSTLPTPLVKLLRIGAQEDARCVSIRAFAAKTEQ
jgi:aminopeptidase N